VPRAKPADAASAAGGRQDGDVEPHTRIAVVGAGPSGLYAVAALLDGPDPVAVDVFDRLPAPYGLVRYGVAPDHPKMKNVIRVLCRPFDRDEVRFFGNVRIGVDLTHEELLEHYHAVVYASGMQEDRGLGIPGEELPGAVGAASFVNWYSGHPDTSAVRHVLDCTAVAVVGAGNVALDVARVLARTGEEMAATDVPDAVLDELRASRIEDIHVLIRRAPQHVKFTPAELRAVGELDNADLLLHDHGFGSGSPPEPEDKRTRQVQELLRKYAENTPTGKPRRIHFRFLRSPVEILGEDRVQGVVLARNMVDADGRVVATADRETIEAGMVISAVGYRSRPLPGIPFDPKTGGVPNTGGRAVDVNGEQVPGVYVTGWLKRGPTGVIGTNKGDAGETARAVLEDLPGLAAPTQSDPDAVLKLLAARDVRVTDWGAWLRLDAEELRLGAGRSCERIKVADLDAILTACLAPVGTQS
jgi:ferredoxin/flavodoxin---NADP+ reductase